MKKITLLTILALLAGCVPPGGEGGGGSPFVALAPIVLIFLLFYFLILRPQQKQGKERDEMMKNLKRGDKIITSGGIFGRIIDIDGDIVTLEISKGVNIRMSRSGVAGLTKIDDAKEIANK